jgi:hypothetical protein
MTLTPAFAILGLRHQPGAKLMPTEQELFQRHFPTFTDAEVAASAQSTGRIVSVAGRAGVPNVFVLALATERGRLDQPLVLSRTAATELRRLLQTEGF